MLVAKIVERVENVQFLNNFCRKLVAKIVERVENVQFLSNVGC